MTRVAVLTYHAIDPVRSVLSVTPREFRSHVEAVARSGRPVVAPSRLAAPFGTDPPVADGSFAFTFDDGYASVGEHAAPVLESFGFPYAVFLVTSWVGRTSDWPSEPLSAPRAPLLGWRDVERLASGRAEIGAHTCDHVLLAGAPKSVVRQQIEESQAEITRRLATEPRIFAYPGGSVDPASREIAGSRFAACFGTRHARMADTDDRAEIPRVEMFYFREPGRFERLFSSAIDARLAARRALRRIRRMAG